MKTLDMAFLRRCLVFDPGSGALIWRERPREHFKSDRSWRLFNSRRSGNVAGTVSATTGYVAINFAGSVYAGHRIAFALHHGQWPDLHIDHANGDRSDNRIGNLRTCSRSQNQQNRPKQRNNTSGYKGVHRHFNGRWRARIQVAGRQRGLGLYDTKEEAYRAYCLAAHRLSQEFANVK